MKKNYITKILCAAMCGVLAAAVAGCGNGGSDSS